MDLQRGEQLGKLAIHRWRWRGATWFNLDKQIAQYDSQGRFIQGWSGNKGVASLLRELRNTAIFKPPELYSVF